MNKRICSMILILTMFLSIIPKFSVIASDYEVKSYQSYVTTVVGHAPYDLFYFYKDGQRIRTPKGVSYKSSDTSIVKVEKTSLTAFFRGKKSGKATVTCTYKGSSASITVYVKKIAADVNGWKNICIPVGTSVYMNVNSYNNKNIGRLTFQNSNSKIVKITKKTVDPFVWDTTVSYSGPEIIAKKEGTATITVKSKVGSEKIKVTVVPKLKLKVSETKRVETEGGYNFSFKITNNSKEVIRVGGPAYVGVYRGHHQALTNEEEKNLGKGESATYTFFVPSAHDDECTDDFVSDIVVQYKGNSILAFINEDGTVEPGMFMGKMPMSATVNEGYL